MRPTVPLEAGVVWLALASGCGGCVASHTPADSGASMDAESDSSDMDAAPVDAPVVRRDVGAPLPDGPLPDGTDCSEVAGFRRCAADQCPYLCPGRVPVRCSNAVPLCLPRRLAEDDPSCIYEVGEPVDIPDPCRLGGPCVLPTDVPAESGQWGACLDLDQIELCLTDYRDVDLPPFHCVWTDMTPVTGEPPPATCPAPAHPAAPFCSGACGTPECRVCVGLSNDRGFGLCVDSTFPCYEGMGGFSLGQFDACERDHGVPCACMVLDPQPPAAPFPRGHVVVASACAAYEAVYPDGVECRNREWGLLAGSTE